MNDDLIEITKLIIHNTWEGWYKFLLNGIKFELIPKNKHSYNTILIRNIKYEHLLNKDRLNLQLIETYNLHNWIDTLLKIGKLNLNDQKEKYEIKISKKVVITSDSEIDKIDLNNTNNLNKAKIHFESYDNFLKEFESILQNETKEKEIEEFIIYNKNKIPFFQIQDSQVPMVNEWDQERKIDITFKKFMNLTSDILELKKSTIQVLGHINDDEDKVRYFWSADTSKAISQVDEYINLANNKRITMKATYFHTKAIILIGRKYDGETNEVLKTKWIEKFESLNKSLENITIVTYDDFYELLLNIRKSFN